MKKVCVRQVALDKWFFPLILGAKTHDSSHNVCGDRMCVPLFWIPPSGDGDFIHPRRGAPMGAQWAAATQWVGGVGKALSGGGGESGCLGGGDGRSTFLTMLWSPE